MLLVREAAALLPPRAVTHSEILDGSQIITSDGPCDFTWRNARLLLLIHHIPPLDVPMPQCRIIFRFQLSLETSPPFVNIHLW